MSIMPNLDAFRSRRSRPETTNYRDLLAALLAEPSTVLLPLVLVVLVLVAVLGAGTSSARQPVSAAASFEAPPPVGIGLMKPSRRFGRK